MVLAWHYSYIYMQLSEWIRKWNIFSSFSFSSLAFHWLIMVLILPSIFFKYSASNFIVMFNLNIMLFLNFVCRWTCLWLYCLYRGIPHYLLIKISHSEKSMRITNVTRPSSANRLPKHHFTTVELWRIKVMTKAHTIWVLQELEIPKISLHSSFTTSLATPSIPSPVESMYQSLYCMRMHFVQQARLSTFQPPPYIVEKKQVGLK